MRFTLGACPRYKRARAYWCREPRFAFLGRQRCVVLREYPRQLATFGGILLGADSVGYRRSCCAGASSSVLCLIPETTGAALRLARPVSPAGGLKGRSVSSFRRFCPRDFASTCLNQLPAFLRRRQLFSLPWAIPLGPLFIPVAFILLSHLAEPHGYPACDSMGHALFHQRRRAPNFLAGEHLQFYTQYNKICTAQQFRRQ